MNKMFLISGVLVSSLLTGCAAVPGVVASTLGTSEAVGGVLGNGAIGCVAGAVAAKVTGNSSSMVKACAAGGAIGGVIGYSQAKQSELKKAQDLQRDLQAQNQQLVVQEQRIEVPKNQQQNNESTVVTVSNMDFTIDKNKLRYKTDDLTQALNKLGVLANDSTAKTKLITVYAPKESIQYIEDSIFNNGKTINFTLNSKESKAAKVVINFKN